MTDNHLKLIYSMLSSKQFTVSGEDLIKLCKNIKSETLAEICKLAETAAEAHDRLSIQHPNGHDKIKAEAIRRFVDIFIKE